MYHLTDGTNVVIGLLVREFCCSGTDVSAKVLAMYAGTRTPSMEPQWLAAGLSQLWMTHFRRSNTLVLDRKKAMLTNVEWEVMACGNLL